MTWIGSAGKIKIGTHRIDSTVFILDSKLLGPVVYFAKLVETGLLAIWAEQLNCYNNHQLWCVRN